MHCSTAYIIGRCDLDDMVALPHQYGEREVDRWSIQDYERFVTDFFEHSHNLRYHILCLIKESRIVFKEYDRVARLFQYREELVSRESSADLEVLG